LSAIGKWFVEVVLGWLVAYVTKLAEAWLERQRKAKERKEDNQAAEQKLEEAESEAEVIEAGSDLLRR
jgi:hypothetical protein